MRAYKTFLEHPSPTTCRVSAGHCFRRCESVDIPCSNDASSKECALASTVTEPRLPAFTGERHETNNLTALLHKNNSFKALSKFTSKQLHQSSHHRSRHDAHSGDGSRRRRGRRLGIQLRNLVIQLVNGRSHLVLQFANDLIVSPPFFLGPVLPVAFVWCRFLGVLLVVVVRAVLELLADSLNPARSHVVNARAAAR
jgi:hypothetical protein